MTKALRCDLCGCAILDGAPPVGWAMLHTTDPSPFRDFCPTCTDGLLRALRHLRERLEQEGLVSTHRIDPGRIARYFG